MSKNLEDAGVNTAFLDAQGRPLSLSTNLGNVNLEVTLPHELALERWDDIKPDLGTMKLP